MVGKSWIKVLFGGLSLPLLVTSLTGCSGVDDGTAAEDLGRTQQAIVNGTNMTATQTRTTGLIAIYHRNSGVWFPRPCSGLIIKYDPTPLPGSPLGSSTVLTARHCLTSNGDINGPLMARTEFRVVAASAPGPANPNPPSGWTPTAVDAMPVTGADSRTRDLGVLMVPVDFSLHVTQRYGILMRNPSTLATEDESLTAYGYGININDADCHNTTVSTGAGVARFGSPFVVTSGSSLAPGGKYSYTNPNFLGQKVVCGDSGGPDIAMLGEDDGGFLWAHVLGVHGGPDGGVMTSTSTGKWLQDKLSGLYMSSYWSRFKNVGWNTATTLRLWPQGDEDVVLLKYDLALQRIIVVATGQCLTSSMTLATCTTSTTHKWGITGNQVIYSVAQPSKCLTHVVGDTLALQNCSFAPDTLPRQMWAFHPQP